MKIAAGFAKRGDLTLFYDKLDRTNGRDFFLPLKEVAGGRCLLLLEVYSNPPSSIQRGKIYQLESQGEYPDQITVV